jgi:hypothetical protein
MLVEAGPTTLFDLSSVCLDEGSQCSSIVETLLGKAAATSIGLVESVYETFWRISIPAV